MGKAVVTNEDVKIEQKPNKTIPDLGEELSDDDRGDIVKPAGGYTSKEEQKYLGDLAFMEEPVEVIINPSGGERNASPVTDYISVNGIPAQMRINGRWCAMGYLPKGEPFVTKRKFLDVLLHAKEDSVKTRMVRLDDGQVSNEVARSTYSVHSVSLLKDENPRGRDWFTRRVSQNF